MNAATSSPAPSDARLHRRRLLVCLDRSPKSEACLPHAIALARTFENAVTLVHILQSHPEHAGPQTHDAVDWEIARQEARGYLERVRQEVSQALGRAVEVRLEQGRPPERIVDLARELRVDVTVIGSHGAGGTPAWSLGSTAQQVLALVRGSVLLVHSATATPLVVAPARILLPLDGSRRGESVLPAAARLANAHHAELLLVHVVQEPLPTALLDAEEDMALAQQLATRLEAAAGQYLSRLQQQLTHDGTAVATLVARHANAWQCLLELSAREHADLVVLSAHGAACDAARSFGSVTTHLLTHSKVPVLVLQDLAEKELQPGHAPLQTPAPPLLRARYDAEHR